MSAMVPIRLLVMPASSSRRRHFVERAAGEAGVQDRDHLDVVHGARLEAREARVARQVGAAQCRPQRRDLTLVEDRDVDPVAHRCIGRRWRPDWASVSRGCRGGGGLPLRTACAKEALAQRPLAISEVRTSVPWPVRSRTNSAVMIAAYRDIALGWSPMPVIEREGAPSHRP
jgi:hypothetical protein